MAPLSPLLHAQQPVPFCTPMNTVCLLLCLHSLCGLQEAHTACYTKFGGGLLKMDTYGATTAMPHSRISQSKFNQERFNRASDRIR